MELTKSDAWNIAQNRYLRKNNKYLFILMGVILVGMVLFVIGQNNSSSNVTREYQYVNGNNTVTMSTTNNMIPNVNKVSLNGIELKSNDKYLVSDSKIYPYASITLMVFGGLVLTCGLIWFFYIFVKSIIRGKLAEKAFVNNGNSITSIKLED